jgi:hypothetical protein
MLHQFTFIGHETRAAKISHIRKKMYVSTIRVLYAATAQGPRRFSNALRIHPSMFFYSA